MVKWHNQSEWLRFATTLLRWLASPSSNALFFVCDCVCVRLFRFESHANRAQKEAKFVPLWRTQSNANNKRLLACLLAWDPDHITEHNVLAFVCLLLALTLTQYGSNTRKAHRKRKRQNAKRLPKLCNVAQLQISLASVLSGFDARAQVSYLPLAPLFT